MEYFVFHVYIYIYIYIYIYKIQFYATKVFLDWKLIYIFYKLLKTQRDASPEKISRSHTTTPHSRWDSSGRVLSSSKRPLPENINTHERQTSYAPSGIRTHNLSRRSATDLRLRPRGHWELLWFYIIEIDDCCLNKGKCSSITLIYKPNLYAQNWYEVKLFLCLIPKCLRDKINITNELWLQVWE